MITSQLVHLLSGNVKDNVKSWITCYVYESDVYIIFHAHSTTRDNNLDVFNHSFTIDWLLEFSNISFISSMDEHVAAISDVNPRLNRSLDNGLNGDDGDGDSRFSENKINGKCFWNQFKL